MVVCGGVRSKIQDGWIPGKKWLFVVAFEVRYKMVGFLERNGCLWWRLK